MGTSRTGGRTTRFFHRGRVGGRCPVHWRPSGNDLVWGLQERFPRADRGVKPLKTPFSYPGSMPRPSLSVFSRNLFEADRTAYTALMRHVAMIDPDHTVIMVQVENEVGLLGAGRDHSALAEAVWNAPLPEELIAAVSAAPESFDPGFVQILSVNPDRSMSWADHFGD